MADVNKVWLNGLVVTEPIMTQLGHDTPSTTFVLRVDECFIDRSGNQRTKSNFLEIESLGRQSSKVKNSVKKGSRVWVEGYLRQEKEENSNIVKVRTYAVYKDDTDNHHYHAEGMKVALDIVKRSRDIHAAIEGIEAVLK